MLTPEYYYVIVGGGLSGLQLAFKISEDIFFKGKKVAIIDPAQKIKNDKTWCYWEKGKGKWDHLNFKQWKHAEFVTNEFSHNYDLHPYSYKMIRSADLYSYARRILGSKKEFTFIQDEIFEIDTVTRTAKGKKKNYTATHFFDSRPPKNFNRTPKISVIYQHFKGIHIRSKEDKFDPDKFTMMDYRIKHKQDTCFTYVLPYSSKEALVEFTFFTPKLTEESLYDIKLKEYINSILHISDYEILAPEQGVIPMTDYPFTAANTKYITKIGTAGGWVKASSGYSFKSTDEKTDQLIENLKSGLPPSSGLLNKKYQKYDAIFLDVLEKRNDLGEKLFTRLYNKNSIQDIFKFLDEQTSFAEEIKIMLSLYHPQFLRSFFRKL